MISNDFGKCQARGLKPEIGTCLEVRSTLGDIFGIISTNQHVELSSVPVQRSRKKYVDTYFAGIFFGLFFETNNPKIAKNLFNVCKTTKIRVPIQNWLKHIL